MNLSVSQKKFDYVKMCMKQSNNTEWKFPSVTCDGVYDRGPLTNALYVLQQF